MARVVRLVVWSAVVGGAAAALVMVRPELASAQQRADSSSRAKRDSVAHRLAEVRVRGGALQAVSAAPPTIANMRTIGARSEVVRIDATSSSLSDKVGRQLFREVPGVFVYDMDGSGNQINIGVRGLDAHRSWELNVRQNGVSTVSDEYGYPASHYSPPMEAIERVELVRGTASLQYGSQFGGMINYVLRAPDTTRRASVESQSSVGSFGLRSTWNGVGGRVGNVTWQGYVALRARDGYRANDESRGDAEFLGMSMPLNSAWSLHAEVGRSTYRYRQPGPLTDAMFDRDAQMSTRSRNWYSPDITVPSVTLTWAPSAATRSTLLLSGVFGTRSSVAVGGFATAADTPSAAGVWSTRQVDIDRYATRSLEWRLQHRTSILERGVTWNAGVAITDNDMRRRQQGTGSRGSDWDLTLQPGTAFRRDLHYRTKNVAAFLEGETRLTSRWTLVPGMRVERGATDMTGRLAYYDPTDTPRRMTHRFPLFGVRSSYVVREGAEWYAGWSQAYRPMILKDVLPETITERTDKSLRDARGWTVETGVRGVVHRVSYDAGAFVMRYANRFGMLTLVDSTGAAYTYKTNVGTTLTRGFEGRVSVPLVPWDVTASRAIAARAFGALSLMHARYVKGSAIRAGENIDVSGNEVESAPGVIARGGVSGEVARAMLTVQVSRVSRTFADALNTRLPSANGATGIVPGYTLTDVDGAIHATARMDISFGVSNVFDAQYFTKRPQFYPGPGVWPSDGRAWHLALRWR